MIWPWQKQSEPTPVVAPIVAQPIVVNPTPAQDAGFAAYRCDAICRDIEQRKAEGREKHREHSQIVGEAKMYAHSLQASAIWTEQQVADFVARLDAACKADQ